MNKYLCRVSDSNGKIVKFYRTGISEEELQTGFQMEGYFPISILLKKEKKQYSQNHISKKVIADFTALMSMLLDSGLGVKDGLRILKTITKDTKTIILVDLIEKDLDAGYSVFYSINNIGSSFPFIYRSMVKIGEKSGDLAFIFQKLNDYLIRQKRMQEKFVSSMIYPVIVLVVAFFSMIMISVFIIPKMIEMFTDSGAEISPGLVQIIYFSKNILTVFIITIPLLIFIIIGVSFIKKRSNNFAMTIDRLRLKLPLIGTFIKDRYFLNILFTLDALTSCGITIEDTLKEVIGITANNSIKEAFTRVHEKVLKGLSLSESLLNEKIIPLRITKWIAVGERTNSMGEVFKNLSGFYENELDKKQARFMSLIEPALIIFTGLIVLGIVVFVIVPLYSTFGSILE